MIKVKYAQDPYSVIGQYIRDHVSAIEDMIAVIEIDGKISNELFMVDMEVDGYFIWKSDWYDGEENVVLIDFFPVSDACNPKDVQHDTKELIAKIKNGISATNADDVYSCGMRNGMRWVLSLVDGKEPSFESAGNTTDVQLVVQWIPCSVINHCFIPELQDFPCGGLLFTYVTQKGKHLVRETWVERGRIVGKKMNGTPIAYMPQPEPYQGKRKGTDNEQT